MAFAQFSGALSSSSSCCGAADTSVPSSSAANPAATTAAASANPSRTTDLSPSSAAANNLAPPSSRIDGEPLNQVGSTEADLLFDAVEGNSSSSMPAEEPRSRGGCSPAVQEFLQSAPGHLQQLRAGGAFVTAAGRRAPRQAEVVGPSDDPAAQLRARTDTTQIQRILGSLERAVVGLTTGDLITVLGKPQLARL